MLWVAALLSAVGCGASVPSPQPSEVDRPAGSHSAQAPAPLTLSVVALSDLHGHAEALPLYAGYVQNLRRVPGRAVLVVDAGDMFQGTVESNLGEGDIIVDAYREIDVAAVAIGNHEFDYGPVGPATTPASPDDDPRGALRARALQAPFPFLLANVTDSAGNALDWANVRPSTLVQLDGVRVGLVGVTTMSTPTTTIAANVAGLTVTPLADAIIREAAALRRRGATVVIALAHAGSECESLADPNDLSSCDQTGEVFELARSLPEGTVDLIVGGHTHHGLAKVVHGIPIIQATPFGRAFARADLVVDRATGRVLTVTTAAPQALCAEGEPPNCAPSPYEGAAVTASARIQEVIAPAFARVASLRARSVGVRVTSTFVREGGQESALGNLFADLLLASVPGADVAVMNGGGLRAALPTGELRYGALFEAMPFDNKLATLRLTGAELAAVLRRNLETDDGILSLAGITATVTCGGDGQLHVRMRRPDGRPVRDRDSLLVVASDFLATGGSAVFSETERAADKVTIEDRLIRDVFAEGLARRREALDPARLFDAAHRRLAYPGARPVHCAPPAGRSSGP